MIHLRLKHITTGILLTAIIASIMTYMYLYTHRNNVNSENPVLDQPGASNPVPAKNNKIPILMYHHINDNVTGEKYYFVSSSNFLRQMRYLYNNGYTPLAFDSLNDSCKYEKPIMITFDDGYLDNYTYAYPVLEMFDFKATIFVATGSLNKPDFLTTGLMKKMSETISFQSHTVNHPNLTTISSKELLRECRESKKKLEKLLSCKISTIAYPYGQYNENVINTVKKYYTYGITGDEGYYRLDDAPFQIKRIPVTCSDTLEDFIKKVQ